MVEADGSLIHDESTATYDGKDNPVTSNNGVADRAALRRINATTTQTIYKKCGKRTTTLTLTVSADGKTETTTVKGVDAAGQTVNTMLVFDTQ
jgi:hypothetical protein